MVQWVQEESSNHSNGTVASAALDKLSQRIDFVESSNMVILAIAQQAQTANVDTVRMLAETQAKLKELADARAYDLNIKVHRADATVHEVKGIHHKCFVTLLKLAVGLEPCDRNIWITGPAGSGKTTAAHKLAETLGVTFEFTGAIDSPYKLSGYMDAVGNYHDTSFRRIFEHGGVILLDEVDGSSPAALLEINAALANSWASFPDGMVERHKDCYILAAANTWGFGGDSNYVGRARLDAAFLDRFVTLSWPYDEQLEKDASLDDEWTVVVQAVRHKAFELGAQVVISPRASIKGGQLRAAGVDKTDVVEAVFGRYRNHSAWSSFGKAAEDYCKLVAVNETDFVPRVNGLTNGGPKLINAKFTSTCDKCGTTIWQGSKIYWNPDTGFTYHVDCRS